MIELVIIGYAIVVGFTWNYDWLAALAPTMGFLVTFQMMWDEASKDWDA